MEDTRRAHPTRRQVVCGSHDGVATSRLRPCGYAVVADAGRSRPNRLSKIECVLATWMSQNASRDRRHTCTDFSGQNYSMSWSLLPVLVTVFFCTLDEGAPRSSVNPLKSPTSIGRCEHRASPFAVPDAVLPHRRHTRISSRRSGSGAAVGHEADPNTPRHTKGEIDSGFEMLIDMLHSNCVVTSLRNHGYFWCYVKFF
jgi:hypothetical protein